MVRLVQNSFFGGQLDYEMMGRQDYQRYAKGATKLCNFNIMKRGGLDKRRGFDRVLRLDDLPGVTVDTKFRAIPFAWQKSHGFVLLMSAQKCIVVETSSLVQFRYYNVTGLDGVYSASEIEELDYQQCGDTLFLAQQNHHPAKIEHVIDGNEHGFHFYDVDIGARKSGVPSITNAIIRRLSVKGNKAAAIVVEEYKASAVFDGIETLPCSAYRNNNPGEPSGTGVDSQDFTIAESTAYRAPWTDSQKISLEITANKGIDSEGNYVLPDRINIYKKAFNYFGLIGTVKVKDTLAISNHLLFKTKTGNADASFTSVHDSDKGELENTPSLLSDEDVSAMEGSMFSNGRNAFLWPKEVVNGNGQNVTLALNMNGASPYNSGTTRFRFYLGSVHYTINKDQVSQNITSVTFTYTGNPKAVIRVVTAKLSSNNYTENGEYSYTSVQGSLWKSATIAKEAGETDEAFDARWRLEYNNFVVSIRGVQYVDVQYPNGGSKYAVVSILDEERAVLKADFIIGGMAAYTTKNATTVYFDDTYITPDSSITPIEETEAGMLESPGNYPASVSLSQQRLIWASSKNDPQRIWMSEVGDFYSYHTHEIMTVSDAIDFQLPVTRFGKINHICEMRKLLLFNSACEWLVDSASSVQGLTYETIQAYPQSYSGSSERLKPIICNNSLIFCERTGQTVRRFAYDISNDGFAGRDVSILSSSIFEFNSIVDWTYQQFPYSTLWCVMKDGTLASFEYMEEQDIMAWMTHELGGGGKTICVATSYAVSPALDDIENVDEYEYATHEEIFAVVKRQNSLWLERMRPRTKTPTDNLAPCEDSLYHSLCLDGVRVLNHTNGYRPTTETGAVWIPSDTTDGSVITDYDDACAKLDSSDTIELYEGFPFDAVYTSVYPNIANGHVGNGQFDIKHIQGCGLRLMHSFGGKITPAGSDLSEPIQYFYNDPQNDHRAQFCNGVVKLHNHNTPIMALPGVNNRDGRVTISQNDPYPFSILSYEIDFEPETGGYR